MKNIKKFYADAGLTCAPNVVKTMARELAEKEAAEYAAIDDHYGAWEYRAGDKRRLLDLREYF